MRSVSLVISSVLLGVGLSLDIDFGGVTDEEPILCYKYTCATPAHPMSNSTCAMYQNGTFYLQLCPSANTTYCIPIDQPNLNSTCQLPPPTPIGTAWPGEPCSVQMDCAYGTCTNKTCVGLTQGTACVLSDQCAPGLYCGEGGVCTPQISINQTCSSEESCVNNAGCNLANSATGTGICQPYLSIAAYEPVSPCLNNSNLLCGSGTCDSNATGSYCLGQLESYAQPPLKCIVSGDCFSMPDPVLGTVLHSNCECSYNPWGMAFCQLFPGDEIGITIRRYLYTWFNSGNSSNCNTKRRTDLNCVQAYFDEEDYLWLAYHQTWYRDFAFVQFLDPCGQQIYQQDYWTIKYAFNHYDSYFNDTDDYSAGAWLQTLGFLSLVLTA